MPRPSVRALALVAVVLGTTLAGAEPPPAVPPAGPVRGDDSLVYQPPLWPEPPNLGAMVTRLAFGTVFVLALCAGTLWAGQRWLGSPTAAKNGPQGRLQLVEVIPLPQRSRLALLAVDNCRVLVVMDASGLKELTLLSEPFVNAFSNLEEGANLRAPADSGGRPMGYRLTSPLD